MAKKSKVAEVPGEDTLVRSEAHLSIIVADAGTKKEQSPIGAGPGSSVVTVHLPGYKPFHVVDDPDADALHRKLVAKAMAEGEEDLPEPSQPVEA